METIAVKREDRFFKFSLGIKGNNENRLVAYQHVRTLGEKESQRDGLIGAFVSDWDSAKNCTFCNRLIVHIFWVKIDNEIKPFGKEHLHEALGYKSEKNVNSKKLIAELEYRQNQDTTKLNFFLLKRVESSIEEANSDYKKYNPELFSKSKLLKRGNDEYIRVSFDSEVELLKSVEFEII